MESPIGGYRDFDLLIVPDATLILIASIIEPLRAANRVLGERRYRWRLFTPDGDAVRTTSGIPVTPDGAFEAKGDRPLVVVASYNWQASATPALLRRLHQAGRHRPLVIGVESGSWLMARADLLKGACATTHWEDHAAFSEQNPETEVRPDRFVIDGKRITTGGALPTVDLMLDIIKRQDGYPLAMEVARLFIYEPATTAAPAPQMLSATGQRRPDRRVRAAVALMEKTLDTPMPLARLARAIGVSARHLQSLFAASLGVAPHVHYMALRLNAARRQVIETRLPLTEIAATTGFSSPAGFSRRYRGHYGESPSETRRRI